MIYFLDRLAEFDAGLQGRDCHLHKINADVYVVCSRCRKKHCICRRFFRSFLLRASNDLMTSILGYLDIESICHIDIAVSKAESLDN